MIVAKKFKYTRETSNSQNRRIKNKKFSADFPNLSPEQRVPNKAQIG